MTDETSNSATVLVVDDESSLADLYAHWLSDEYEVLTAYGGEDALDTLHEDVDVVLLDRRMPDLSGDEVLEEIRQHNYNVRVAMVTAVDPDFDIIDMECDDYLVKSVSEMELKETVDHLLELSSIDEKVKDLSSKRLRRNVLEVEKTDSELEESEEFQQLEREIEQLEQELGQLSEEVEGDEIERHL